MTKVTIGLRPAPRCDCRSCPLWVHNPAAVEPICSGCNTDCSYCGCARAETGRAMSCGQCPIRCGSRVDIGAWMADVGGTLSFDDIDLTGPAWPRGVPAFVPMLDAVATAREVDPGLGWPAYGIGLRRVFLPGSLRIADRFRQSSAHEAIGLRADQLAVLVGYGEDPLVEAFWSKRHSGGLTEAVAGMGWDLALTPNFSMYGNQPRTEHLLNFRRNLLVAAELADLGVAAVPNLYWYRLEDLERIVAWAADTLPVAVATNCQTFCTDDAWAEMLVPGFTYLAAALDDLGAATKVVLTGLSRADRIAQAVAIFGDRLVVVSQNPIQYARHGAVMTDSGRADLHATVADAFAANVRYYASLLP